MRMSKCNNCIRECVHGISYCGRKNTVGHLKFPNRYCAVSVDRLFDKPITHFSDNIRVLSIGSYGCNLRCLGCQNAKLSWSTSDEYLKYIEMEPAEVVALALQNQCKGICYTYNEPAILIDTVEEISKRAKEAGLFNFLVTNSTLSLYSTMRLAPLIDAVAADIKSMSDDFYYQYCGAEGIANVAEKILTCIKTFNDMGSHVEVRTNIIQGRNDQEANFHAIASWIRDNLKKDAPWHITRFFPAHKLDSLTKTNMNTLLSAQEIGIEEGLKYSYVYFSKSCDCAKDHAMVSGQNGKDHIFVESCCA